MNEDRKGGLRGNDVKEGEGKRKARVLLKDEGIIRSSGQEHFRRPRQITMYRHHKMPLDACQPACFGALKIRKSIKRMQEAMETLAYQR